MKLFAVADIHGAQYRLNLALKHIETFTPDLCVICGDITQFGPAEVATSFLNQIPVETVAVPGNIDPFDVHQAIDKELERVVVPMRERGGYFPSLDHWVFKGVRYVDFQYYCRQLEIKYGVVNQSTRFVQDTQSACEEETCQK